MSIVFAILFKERKIDKSISITEYKRFDIVKMFHGMYPHTAIKHTKKVYLVLMQNSKVCLAIFVNFFRSFSETKAIPFVHEYAYTIKIDTVMLNTCF